MRARNAFYAQSGGVTAVINASAAGVIATARQHPDKIATVYAGKNGILGALQEELIDTAGLTDEQVRALCYTPGGAFGSCRYKLKSFEEHQTEYERLLEVFAAHQIGYFFYNGGGDSQDTAHKVALLSERKGYPLTCIGIPKTVDNDLPYTDTCPGFGSVAKYVAIATLEAGLDIASMSASSTKVFILEVMGRHAGWIAAAAGLAANNTDEPPHLILFPEIAFQPAVLLKKVKETVQRYGYCVIVASEGLRNAQDQFIVEAGTQDAFGHVQLGGVAPYLAQLVKQGLGYKCHWAVADYLQRSARHTASAVDVEQAYAVGEAAVNYAIAGENAIMPIIVRDADQPYRWHIDKVPLACVANIERPLPREYIREDGFGITDAGRRYLAPLIEGEAYPPYSKGLPHYIRLQHTLVAKQLPSQVFA